MLLKGEKTDMTVKISDGMINLRNIQASKPSVRAVLMRPIESDHETWTQKDLAARLKVQCCLLLFPVGPSGVARSAPFLLLTTIWTQQLTCQYQTQPLCTFFLNKPYSFGLICLYFCEFGKKVYAMHRQVPALKWTEVHTADRTYKDVLLLSGWKSYSLKNSSTPPILLFSSLTLHPTTVSVFHFLFISFFCLPVLQKSVSRWPVCDLITLALVITSQLLSCWYRK